jgi:ornithine cyclodeaminase/alanine dehydrogenase-like protein (mu-crystallin family)
MKWIECHPRNPREHDLPQTTGLLMVNDVDTGAPIALMDSTWMNSSSRFSHWLMLKS